MSFLSNVESRWNSNNARHVSQRSCASTFISCTENRIVHFPMERTMHFPFGKRHQEFPPSMTGRTGRVFDRSRDHAFERMKVGRLRSFRSFPRIQKLGAWPERPAALISCRDVDICGENQRGHLEVLRVVQTRRASHHFLFLLSVQSTTLPIDGT